MKKPVLDRKAFKGVFSVVPTPLLENQEVDYRGLEVLIRFYVDQGCHGLLVLGSYGELPYFTFDERIEIVRRAVRAVDGHVPVIACVGYCGLREAALFLEKTKHIPLDGYLAVLPTYFRVAHADCLRYYRDLGTITDRPLLYYHIPQLTGISPSPGQLSELLNLGCISGIKDSSMNLGTLKRTASLMGKAGLPYFAGSGFLLLETLGHGGAGVMCTVASLSPRTVVDCYDAYSAGDHVRARVLQDRILDFLPLMNSFAMPASVQKFGFAVLSRIRASAISPRQAILKEYLRQNGFPVTSVVRSPLPQLTESDRAAVSSFIKKGRIAD